MLNAKGKEREEKKMRNYKQEHTAHNEHMNDNEQTANSSGNKEKIAQKYYKIAE